MGTMSTGPPNPVRKMWRGELTRVDTIDALQLVQWAYMTADIVEPRDATEAEYLRNCADSALSALILVLKRRSAPIPHQSFEALRRIQERQKTRRKAA